MSSLFVFICHNAYRYYYGIQKFIALYALYSRTVARDSPDLMYQASMLGWWLAEGWVDLTGGVHEGVHICLCDLGLPLRDL